MCIARYTSTMNSSDSMDALRRQQQLDQQVHQLCQMAMQNADRGQLQAARELLDRAVQLAPGHALALAYLGRVLHRQGQIELARTAFDQAVAAMPSAWGPRFEKAQFLESVGDVRNAALMWRIGLQFMAPEQQADPTLRDLVQRAEAAQAQDAEALHEHLWSRTDELRNGESDKHLRRYLHCLDIATGRRPFVTAQPIHLPFPELPAIQFFDRTDFAWARDVEAQTDRVVQELLAVSAADAEGFVPYVQTREGESSGQFDALDRDDGWSAYFLWNQGVRVDAHCERCPATEAAVAMAPQIQVKERAPAVFFSALRPHTKIPPHNGATNARLTVHLPLIIPPDCALQVGDEVRTWKQGELLIFDDTIRHSAWNRSDQRRVVLIFDIWNPLLSDLEQQLVARTIEGMIDYYGSSNDLGEL